MELQQRFSVSANEYEEGEVRQESDSVKTENIYQSLHQQSTRPDQTYNNTTVVSDHSWRKCAFLLFAVNILILTIILAIVGQSYSLHKQIHLIQVANGQRMAAKEEWLLHDNVFYLFWSEQSDCSTAVRFCSERNASLATLTVENRVWLQSKVNGKQFFFKSTSDGSGYDMLTDEEEQESDITCSDIDKDHKQGFVCERKAKPKTFNDYLNF